MFKDCMFPFTLCVYIEKIYEDSEINTSFSIRISISSFSSQRLISLIAFHNTTLPLPKYHLCRNAN